MADEYATFTLPKDSVIDVEYVGNNIKNVPPTIPEPFRGSLMDSLRQAQGVRYDRPVCEIRIYDDLARPAEPYVRGPFPGTNCFEIHVPAREEDMKPGLNGRHSLLAAWCHEIGHVIAMMFRLPNAMRDPRNALYESMMSIAETDPAELRFRAEQEAWDVADFLIGYNRTREAALRSYQRRIV